MGLLYAGLLWQDWSVQQVQAISTPSRSHESGIGWHSGSTILLVSGAPPPICTYGYTFTNKPALILYRFASNHACMIIIQFALLYIYARTNFLFKIAYPYLLLFAVRKHVLFIEQKKKWSLNTNNSVLPCQYLHLQQPLLIFGDIH